MQKIGQRIGQKILLRNFQNFGQGKLFHGIKENDLKIVLPNHIVPQKSYLKFDIFQIRGLPFVVPSKGKELLSANLTLNLSLLWDIFLISDQGKLILGANLLLLS